MERARRDAWLGMPPSRFLRERWQRRPLLVRGALPGLRDPIDADELAGLACEDGVESRLVRERGGARPWEVTWGPQDERALRRLPEKGWTLLVQEVNRWVPEAALLLESFAFIPNVRVDDVMVSFAAPGGSVGPHLDSYDVFLVQGSGRRRWRWHERPTRETELRPGLDLRILRRFAPEAEAVLDPGDVLYLPPGFAHHGVAVTPCLTYSIGFRAPSAGEAWTSFAAAAARSQPGRDALLADPPLRPASNPGVIPPSLLARARAFVRGLDVSDDAIDRWFASFATQLKPGHDLEAPRRPPTAPAILRRLARGAVIARSEEARWAFLPRAAGLFLYVGGEEIPVGRRAAPLAQALCAARRHDLASLRRYLASADARALLALLFARGALTITGR